MSDLVEFNGQMCPVVATIQGYRIVAREAGAKILLSSPDYPGLYAAASSLEEALTHIPAAIEMLDRMTARRQEKQRVQALSAA
jgi:hypothetical protein